MKTLVSDDVEIPDIDTVLGKPPRWDDEKSAASFVARVIWFVEWGVIPPWSMPVSMYLASTGELPKQIESVKDWVPRLRESAAFEEADRGDLKRLVNMLRPLDGALNPAIKSITPRTWTLVAEFLTSERSLLSGRPRGKPGKPKMSKTERRTRNPVHTAAVEFPAIKDILKRWYPNQTRAAIRERAAAIAADRNGIKVATLENHCGRRKSDRRRI